MAGWLVVEPSKAVVEGARQFGSFKSSILAEDKLMGTLYFEDVEVGDSCAAGPNRVTKSEIIQFAKQYDPVPETSMRRLQRVRFSGG